ncbi:Hypothetical predicted protein, partial [Paramuricea clavata]
NDANVYDYATTERGMGKGPWLNDTDQDKHSDVSPVYADANDTDTSFYFTLERNPAEVTADADEGTYVIAIPDNVYDKPEDDTTMELNNGGTNIQGGGQFYHTLEECDEELSCQNTVPKETEKQDGVSIEIEEHELSDNDTYVVNIPNDENGMKYKLSEAESKGETTESENEDTEQTYVVNIPNENIDAPKVSPKINGDKSLRQIGIEKDINDGYSGQLGVEEDNCDRQKRINSSSAEDEFGPKVDGYYSEEIYENVNTCLYPNNEGHVAHKMLPEEFSIAVKNETNSENNTAAANSQGNLGYIDDDLLAQNKIDENARQNSIDNDNTHVVQVETLASARLSENTTRNDNQCYFDDDIYEDWEDNIIGRVKTVSGESGDELNASADEQNESGDEIYQNFDIINEQDQDSGESFYQNLKDFRPSLVMQDVR